MQANGEGPGFGLLGHGLLFNWASGQGSGGGGSGSGGSLANKVPCTNVPKNPPGESATANLNLANESTKDLWVPPSKLLFLRHL